MYTCASTVKVGVAVVAIGALAAVSDTIGGVDAIAVGAPAPVVRPVALGDVAVGDVPDGPVEHDGHGEVAGSVEEGAIAVVGVDPPVLRHEHVLAFSGVEMAEDGFRRRELLLVGDVSRWFLCLIQREYVRLVDVESAGHGVLAAPRLAGALARQVTLRLRPPARGCAASDVVIVGVNQVAKDGAPEHDKAVPLRGEPVGNAATVVRRAV